MTQDPDSALIEKNMSLDWVNPIQSQIDDFLDTIIEPKVVRADFWEKAKAVWLPETREVKNIIIHSLYRKILKIGTKLSALESISAVVACFLIEDSDTWYDHNLSQVIEFLEWLPLLEESMVRIRLVFEARILAYKFQWITGDTLWEQWEKILARIETVLNWLSTKEEAFFGEVLAHFMLRLEQYDVNTPLFIMKLLNQSHWKVKDFLKRVPFLWRKDFFHTKSTAGLLANHRRLNGVSLLINLKSITLRNRTRQQFKALRAEPVFKDFQRTAGIEFPLKYDGRFLDSNRIFYLLQHDPRMHIVAISCWDNDSYLHLINIPTDKLKSIIALTNPSQLWNYALFPQLTALQEINWDEEKLSKMRQWISQTGVGPRVDSTALDVTILVNPTFVSPVDHHRNILLELWCSVVDSGFEIGESDWNSRPRYQDHHEWREIQYSQKLRTLVQKLRSKLVKDDSGKVKVHLFASSPYMLLDVVGGGSIIVSDIEGIGTQVFARTIDHEFLTADFSLRDLGDTFWPWTTVRSILSDRDSQSDESTMNAWIARIEEALYKSTGYYHELQWGATTDVDTTLKSAYASWEIRDIDLVNPKNFKKWLDAFNKWLIDNPKLDESSKKAMAIINGKWASLDISQIIRSLGGSGYITFYHGHARFFSEYMKKLLVWDKNGARDIFDQLRSTHVVAKKVQIFFTTLKQSQKKISKKDLIALFGRKNGRQEVIDDFAIPYGLYSCVSWLIALWVNPDEVAPWQTQFDLLLDTLDTQVYSIK